MKRKKSLQIALAALFTALITALTTVHLPLPSEAGYVHFGDAMIYLAACILPAPYALASAALGGALADGLFGFFNWLPLTFFIKAVNTLPFLLCRKFETSQKLVTAKTVLASVGSGVITCVLYFFAAWLVYGTAPAALADVPGSLVQAVGSSVLFILFGAVLDKTKFNLRG